MPDLQTMFPIYLPKQDEKQTPEAYSAAIGENELNINENFRILFDAVVALMAEKGTN